MSWQNCFNSTKIKKKTNMSVSLYVKLKLWRIQCICKLKIHGKLYVKYIEPYINYVIIRHLIHNWTAELWKPCDELYKHYPWTELISYINFTWYGAKWTLHNMVFDELYNPELTWISNCWIITNGGRTIRGYHLSTMILISSVK